LGAVHQVEMEMRGIGAPGVSERPDSVTLLDSLALSNRDAASDQVRVERVLAPFVLDDDVIPCGNRLHPMPR